jgi:hypothetical protein
MYFRALSKPRRSGYFVRNLRFEPLERKEMLSATLPKVTKVEVASTAWSSSFVSKLTAPNTIAHGYAIPLGSSAQAETLTWDNINQITITFNEDVVIDEADLSLSGANTAAYHFGAFHYDPIQHAATWTLAAPLNKDRLRIDLDASGADAVQDLEGNVLDGEWTNNSSTISGNGTAGGDFEFNFNVLPTDVNNTGGITSYDYVYIRQLEGKITTDTGYLAKRDIDGNGVINSTDWQKALDRMSQTLPGGSAAGTSNDAPTTSGFDSVQIDDYLDDVAISLLERFADLESGSSGLSYSILSVSNAELFDSATINATTKSLVLNAAESASGRSSIVVRATDAGGLTVDMTISVDVNYENQAPEIVDYSISYVSGNVYLVTGQVVDDSDVSDYIVTFSNAFNIRSAVDQNGYFQFAVELPSGTTGIEDAVTQDPQGLASLTYSHQIYMT